MVTLAPTHSLTLGLLQRDQAPHGHGHHQEEAGEQRLPLWTGVRRRLSPHVQKLFRVQQAKRRKLTSLLPPHYTVIGIRIARSFEET